MKLLIITGSRNWNDERAIRSVVADEQPCVLMHGAAPGADSIAHRVAQKMAVPVLPMPAQWNSGFGRSAGPIRNSRMVEVAHAMRCCGWEVVVHAFPRGDSFGTRDMIRQCQQQRPPLEVVVHEGRGG